MCRALGEKVAQEWFGAIDFGGGGSGKVKEAARERAHSCRGEVGRRPRNPSAAQEQWDGLGFVASQQPQERCCFRAPPAAAPAVLRW